MGIGVGAGSVGRRRIARGTGVDGRCGPASGQTYRQQRRNDEAEEQDQGERGRDLGASHRSITVPDELEKGRPVTGPPKFAMLRLESDRVNPGH